MRARLSPWLIAAATCWALGAQAANLGTIGPTYPVAEKNLLDVIMARLRAKEASGELKRHEQEARDRAAYAVNKHLSVTAAYADLGTIATFKGQRGLYLSLQAGF